VAYLFLDVCEKIHQFLSSIKKMHTKENWFFFLPHGVIITNSAGAAGCMFCCCFLAIPDRPHTRAHPFNGPFFRDYPGEPVPLGKTNLDFTEARDSE